MELIVEKTWSIVISGFDTEKVKKKNKLKNEFDSAIIFYVSKALSVITYITLDIYELF